MVSGSHTFTVKIQRRYQKKLATAKRLTLYVIVAAENAAGAQVVKVYTVRVSR